MSNLTISDLNEAYLIDLSEEEKICITGGENFFMAVSQAFGIGVAENSTFFGNLFLNLNIGSIVFNFA